MRTLLTAIRGLEDLTALVSAAGHEPLFQELPADRWRSAAPLRAALLGHYSGFEWLGFETAGPAMPLAGGIARGLAKMGRLACVLALNPHCRQLVITVTHPPRPVLCIDLAAPNRLAQYCLKRLEGASSNGALGAALHLAQALDADAVGRRFFGEFRRVLASFRDALPRRIPLEDRHTLALLQLTRLLFLYFVQAKGWLAGRPAFLREEFDRSLTRGKPVHRDLFRPLFFGTLNSPPQSRGPRPLAFGAVPFLNGGLFEPHFLEKHWPMDLPDECWRESVDALFERFHFSSEEDRPDQIAPDMLGRVFEGVMGPEERSGFGAFYTPTALVRALVTATLAAFLAERLGLDLTEAEARLAEPDAAVRQVLEHVTILDPAVGSGAFLLGALQALAVVAPGRPHLIRRRILARNLFGVDLDPTAVRLTELRLWLALIDVDPAECPADVHPLPNLDSVVRQGDSLTEPTPLHARWHMDPAAALRMRELRSRLQDARGAEKAGLVRALRQAERTALDEAIRSAETTTARSAADLVAQGRGTTLFGDRRGLSRTERRTLERLRAERRQLWRLRRQLQRDGTLPWFHFQSQFAEVFADGGFDVVVGNPPWIRAETLSPALRERLAGRYRWWRPGTSGRGYAHQPDISIAFLERSHELVKEGGTVGMLLPAKLATAGYGGAARAGLTAATTIRIVADLTGDARAGFDATAYPLALITTRRRPVRRHLVRRGLGTGTADLPQHLLGEGSWTLVPGPVAALIARLRASHPRLDERFPCRLGVKTGANHVFLDPPLALEPEVLGWALRGRDVHAFRAAPAVRLLWTHDPGGKPLSQLPHRASAWIERHRAALERRRDHRGGVPWALFRVAGAVAAHRVVWADLAARLEAVALGGVSAERVIPLNTCYILAAPDRATAHRLTAWLNCTWMRAIAQASADPASGGYRRFNARTVGALPLPSAVLSNDGLAAVGAESASGTSRQRELDRLSAELLGLTRREQGLLSDSRAAEAAQA